MVGGIFCDLQKAFDCVNHDILLLKLNFYGITVRINTLLESSLKNRFQRVIIDNKPRQYFSKWEPAMMMFCKAPYSFPSFFYCILMISHSPSNPVLFAEDTNMTIIGSDPHEFSRTVNNSITNINICFISNLLSLNIDKTQFLQFLRKTVGSLTYQFPTRINILSKLS